MAERDYYVVLGVPRDASPAGIRAAFRDLAKRTHPDRAGAESALRFAEVREAYETLADAESRRAYDERLAWRERSPQDPRRGRFPEAAGGPPPATGRPAPAQPRRSAPPAPAAPEVIRCQVVLSPEEAARGGELPMRVPVAVPCAACGGTGWEWLFPCAACVGSGGGRGHLDVRLPIPTGVPAGARLELPLERYGLSGVALCAWIWIRD